MGPFLLAAAAMFTAMYSTQAILPELGRAFSVGPSQTGLTVSVVIGALAVGAWFWGPLSDRIGRRASLVLASGALVVPSLGVALAPSFAVLLAMRAAQGLCIRGCSRSASRTSPRPSTSASGRVRWACTSPRSSSAGSSGGSASRC